MNLAVEIKGAARVHEGDIRGLAALRGEWKVRRDVVVSLERAARRTDDGIDILPWRVFVDRLWAGDLGV